MIELKNLVKRYGDHLAVDHLNLTIEEGRIYGFLGPNGAGKSTTMNMMTGYLSATEGEIIINGHNILEEPEEAKRCIGYLPEIPPLYMDMTVREYLQFCAELKAVPKAEREKQIREAEQLTRLSDVDGRLIHNLSKGYRQRVGLAQAILGFPPIIILDEPTVGLDPKQIIEIRDLIRKLSEEHTVILSSHILSEVQEICDQIIIISHGRLVANDTADHLEEHLRGETTLRLTVRASREAAEGLLASVPGVSVLECAEDGNGCASLTLDMAEDVREEIFFTFARAEKPILEMTLQSASLEDVFLELTETDVKPAAEEEEEPDGESAEAAPADGDFALEVPDDESDL